MIDTFIWSTKNILIRADQSTLTCWLCEKLAYTKCAGFTGRTSDDLTIMLWSLSWSCSRFGVVYAPN